MFLYLQAPALHYRSNHITLCNLFSVEQSNMLPGPHARRWQPYSHALACALALTASNIHLPVLPLMVRAVAVVVLHANCMVLQAMWSQMACDCQDHHLGMEGLGLSESLVGQALQHGS